MWFPAIAVTLPPGGIDFSCHAGTVCKRDYVYNSAGSSGSRLDDAAANVGDLTVKSDDGTAKPQVNHLIRDVRPKLKTKPKVETETPKPQ